MPTTNSPLPVLHRVLLWILIATLALGQLQRMQLNTSVAIYLHELVLAGIIAVAWQRKLLPSLKFVIRRIATSPFAWFIGWAVGSTIFWSIRAVDVVPILYLARIAVLTTGSYSVWQLFPTHPVYLKLSMVSLGVLWALLGLQQYFLVPDTRFLLMLGWDEHYYRLIGTLFDPAFTGILLVLGWVLLFRLSQFLPPATKILLATLFSSSILLTYSRASYGALALAAIGILILRKKTALAPVFISLTVGVLVLLIAPKPGGEGVNLNRTSTVAARSNQIQQLLEKLTPIDMLLGNGLFQQLPQNQNSATQELGIPYHARLPDNVFMLLLQGTGVVGIAALGYGLYQSHTKLIVYPYLTIALVSVIWHSQFNNTVLHSFVLLYLLLGFVWDNNPQLQRKLD